MVQLSHQHVTTGKIKALTIWASLIAQLVKNLPAMWETCVRSLGWEGPLEKEMTTHSSIYVLSFITTYSNKSYVKSRQHIIKQRHHFADKGPSSRSHGFSSSHVWMSVGP